VSFANRRTQLLTLSGKFLVYRYCVQYIIIYFHARLLLIFTNYLCIVRIYLGAILYIKTD